MNQQTRTASSPERRHEGFASYFSQTVLAVLFGLTLRAALENGVKPLIDSPDVASLWAAMQADSGRYWIDSLQLTAFVLTLCRFYAGAYRFHQSQPEGAPLTLLLFDASWTLFLFVSFYVAALLVATRGLFAWAIVLMHVVDFFWFLLGPVVASPSKHLHKVITLYIVYDVATVGLFLVSWWLRGYNLDSPNLQWMPAAILLLMFAIDMLWVTRDWYFNPELWKQTYGG